VDCRVRYYLQKEPHRYEAHSCADIMHLHFAPARWDDYFLDDQGYGSSGQ